MSKFVRDWKETWVDRMGLIVALGGRARFDKLADFKLQMACLPAAQRQELNECLRLRFTPTNGQDGCRSATQAIKEAANV